LAADRSRLEDDAAAAGGGRGGPSSSRGIRKGHQSCGARERLWAARLCYWGAPMDVLAMLLSHSQSQPVGRCFETSGCSSAASVAQEERTGGKWQRGRPMSPCRRVVELKSLVRRVRSRARGRGRDEGEEPRKSIERWPVSSCEEERTEPGFRLLTISPASLPGRYPQSSDQARHRPRHRGMASRLVRVVSCRNPSLYKQSIVLPQGTSKPSTKTTIIHHKLPASGLPNSTYSYCVRASIRHVGSEGSEGLLERGRGWLR